MDKTPTSNNETKRSETTREKTTAKLKYWPFYSGIQIPVAQGPLSGIPPFAQFVHVIPIIQTAPSGAMLIVGYEQASGYYEVNLLPGPYNTMPSFAHAIRDGNLPSPPAGCYSPLVYNGDEFQITKNCQILFELDSAWQFNDRIGNDTHGFTMQKYYQGIYADIFAVPGTGQNNDVPYRAFQQDGCKFLYFSAMAIRPADRHSFNLNLQPLDSSGNVSGSMVTVDPDIRNDGTNTGTRPFI